MDIPQLGAILRENGIVGAGGAGFPTYGKLSDKIDTVLMNCAECEPLLKLHRQLLSEHTYEILKAFALIAETLGAGDAAVGIKGEYKDAIHALETYMDAFPSVRIHRLDNAYPMGDEVVLIYEATGRVVPPGGLPLERGVAVFNVETLYNVYRAVWENHPVTDKYVTVVGEVERPATLCAPIGMPIRDVVALAGPVKVKNPLYLIGGPMMGSFGEGSQPVTKTTNAVIVLPPDHVLSYRKRPNIPQALRRASSACCQCRTCTDLCPRHALGHPIQPHLFMRAASGRDVQTVEPYINTLFCCSCGLCETFSCPQGLSPRSIMAAYKKELLKNGVRAPKTEAASVNADRDYRKVPEGRLLARLGLSAYEKEVAFLGERCPAASVRVLLSQHIGKPAEPCVKMGDRVETGSVIARAAKGLSVNIHAPVSGIVTEVSGGGICIKA